MHKCQGKIPYFPRRLVQKQQDSCCIISALGNWQGVIGVVSLMVVQQAEPFKNAAGSLFYKICPPTESLCVILVQNNRWPLMFSPLTDWLACVLEGPSPSHAISSNTVPCMGMMDRKILKLSSFPPTAHVFFSQGCGDVLFLIRNWVCTPERVLCMDLFHSCN